MVIYFFKGMKNLVEYYVPVVEILFPYESICFQAILTNSITESSALAEIEQPESQIMFALKKILFSILECLERLFLSSANLIG